MLTFPRFLLSLSVAIPLSVAAGPLEDSAQKHLAYKSAIAAMEREIASFQERIDGCNPPFKGQIVASFFDPQNTKSALSALRAHARSVDEKVLAAEQKIAEARKLATACGPTAQALENAGSASREARDGLLEALERYQSKLKDAAGANESKLLFTLKMRGASPALVDMKVGKGDVSQCSAALKQVDAMHAASAELQARLAELAGAYGSGEQATGESLLAASAACGAMQAAALPEEYVLEGETGSAL